jgi:hypothetical protein
MQTEEAPPAPAGTGARTLEGPPQAATYRLLWLGAAGMGLIASWIEIVSGCSSCSDRLPASYVGADLLALTIGFRWAATERFASAALLSFFLLACHLALMLSASGAPCALCVLLLVAHSALAVYSLEFLRTVPVQRPRLLAAAVLGACIGMLATYAARELRTPGAEASAAREEPEAGRSALQMTIFVQPGCGGCEKLREELSLQGQALVPTGAAIEIVDVSTPAGSQRGKRHRVVDIPTVIFTAPSGSWRASGGGALLRVLRAYWDRERGGR